MRIPIRRPIKAPIKHAIIAVQDPSTILQTWVPNLIGSQYGQLDTPWQPSGAEWGVDATVFNAALGNSIDKYVMDCGGFSTGMLLRESASNFYQIRVGNVTGSSVSSAGLEYYTFTGDENSSAGQWSSSTGTAIGARINGGETFKGQIHSALLTDPLDSNNTLNLDFTIKAAQMPSAANTGIYDQDGNDVGEWIGLDPVAPYVRIITDTQPPLTANDFVMTVRTTAPSETFTLPFQSTLPASGAWNATIYWGDGQAMSLTSYNDPNLTHTYDLAGDYDITIVGDANCVLFANTGDKLKVIDVKQWGKTGWTLCLQSFFGCSNCVFTAHAACDTSNVTHMGNMFRDCSVANPDVSGFNTSNVTNMNQMFLGCSVANPYVSSWDTSNVTNMVGMFRDCSVADPNVSGFNISKVTNMTDMMLNSAFSDANYDLALPAFNDQPHQLSVTAHFGTAKYSAGAPATARAGLVADSWIITDGGQA